MTSWMQQSLGSAVVALAFAGVAAAQESTNRVASNTDWSVFVEESPKECWGVSAPKETVNSKDGQVVTVRRGDILLFITFRPGASAGEVSFSGGYPFAGGSTVAMEVDGQSFNLFTDGEWAWSGTPDDDKKIMAAMQKGSSAVLTARSSRGTQTKDTFSLLGFTAAMDEAGKRCK